VSTLTITAAQAIDIHQALVTLSQGDTANGTVIRQPDGVQRILPRQYKLSGAARMRIARAIIALQPEMDAAKLVVEQIRKELGVEDGADVPDAKLPEFTKKCDEAGAVKRRLSVSDLITEKDLALDKNEISPMLLVTLMPVISQTP